MTLNPGLQTLKERGFIQQCTDLEALSKKMDEGPLSFYVGFDPTGPSLHVGHMVPVFAAAHLQRAGHNPVLLLGTGTARIGDPSGKTEMRKMLSYEDIDANAVKMGAQLGGIVELGSGEGSLVKNGDWLSNLNYIDFLRDIGRHFSVNRMLTFEAYKQRLETGLSFIEFNYQLLQSYDYLELFRRKGCTLQIGGDDQWGNIVAGIDLIRRMEGGETYGLTFPLVTRADGKKMGKTEKGAIFLDESMCPVYDFFQYWRNVHDDDVEKFLLLFTFMPADEIHAMCSAGGAALNKAKETLAFEYTKLVHGEQKAKEALEGARAAFGGGGDEASIPGFDLPASEIANGIGIIDLFTITGLVPSKSEARRLVQQGGARVNDEQITDIDKVIGMDAVNDDKIMLKAGKKKHMRVTIVS